MTLFEIFTYGQIPFKNLSNNEVMSSLLNGSRPELPENCPLIIEKIAKACWEEEPEKRISADIAYSLLNQFK